MAFQCPDGPDTYHTLEDMLVEEIDQKILVTKLFPSVFPLIRYETGDSGSLGESTCSCGFTGLSIFNLQGRKKPNDWLPR
jgi:phenylacetate-CoA ligase